MTSGETPLAARDAGRKQHLTTRRQFLFRSILIASSASLSLALGESLVRIVRPRARYASLPDSDLAFLRYSADPYLGWELVPGLRDHNAEGFRGRSYERIKPAGTRRIAILGDSVTYGLGISADESYPAQLETRLNARGSGRFEVLNFGVPGYSTFQALTMLRKRALDYQPDLVILTFSTDDVETSPVVIEVDGTPTLFRNQFEGHWWFNNTGHWVLFRRSHLYRLFYERLVTASLPRGGEFRDVFIDADVALANVIAAYDLCVQQGVRFAMAFSPLIPPYFDSNPNNFADLLAAMSTVRSWAHERAVPSVEFGPIFDEGQSRYKQFDHDHEHPNAAGTAAMAEEVAEMVGVLLP